MKTQTDLLRFRATFWRYLADAQGTEFPAPKETTLKPGYRWVPYSQPDRPNPPRKRLGWAQLNLTD